MSARLARLEFEEGTGFDVPPRFEKYRLEEQFSALKEILLAASLDENETLSLEPRLELAANEAAALAWSTGYPMLTFPALFDELARRERTRELRQQQITALTEGLLEHAV